MAEKLFYLNQSCDDFDQYCANARGWDLDYHQLESGLFASQRLSFGQSRFMFSHTRITRRLLQRGTTTAGLVTFGLLANPDISINWRNTDIQGDSLFIFPPHGELHSVTPAGFDAFPLSLSEQKLNEVCSLLELPEFRKLINKNEIFLCDPQKLRAFRGYLMRVEYRLIHDAYFSRHLSFLHEIEDGIANILVKLLAEHSQPTQAKRMRMRDAALKTADAYIRENSGYPLSVPELCSAANASQRMLEYAFRERYAMTPKAYIQTFRLNKVRAQLKKTDPGTGRVTRIAQQNGFTHMGQFSAYYKKLFLERPSDTLRGE